jgi:Tfp pilus assembly protein PilZ
MEDERRRAPRTAFRLEVEVWGHQGAHKIEDLSTSGVFIHTERPSQYKPGDVVDLVLKFPTEGEAMLINARVSRITEEGIGVKFINLTPYYAEIIEKCYEALSDTNGEDDS